LTAAHDDFSGDNLPGYRLNACPGLFARQVGLFFTEKAGWCYQRRYQRNNDLSFVLPERKINYSRQIATDLGNIIIPDCVSHDLFQHAAGFRFDFLPALIVNLQQLFGDCAAQLYGTDSGKIF